MNNEENNSSPPISPSDVYSDFIRNKELLNIALNKAVNATCIESRLFSSQLENLYHDAIRCVINLHRGDSCNQNNWLLFTEAADKLVKFHKFTEKKLKEIYKMAYQQGIVAYSQDFLTSLSPDLLTPNSINENRFILTKSLCDVLQHPDDPQVSTIQPRRLIRGRRRFSIRPSIIMNRERKRNYEFSSSDEEAPKRPFIHTTGLKSNDDPLDNQNVSSDESVTEESSSNSSASFEEEPYCS